MKNINMDTKYAIVIVAGMLITSILISGCIQRTENNSSIVNGANHIKNNSKVHSICRNYTTYANADFNFSIDYPDDWTMVPMKSKITFLSPKQYEGGYITLTMQLLSSSDSGGTYNSVDDVIKDLIHQYKEHNENITNVNINYEREDILSGSAGKELSISYTLYGMNYTQTQIIARSGNFFYVIMYIAQSEHYNESADVYEYAKRHFKMSID